MTNDGEFHPSQTLRDASKWLTASGGVLVAACVAGLQLAGLSNARLPELALLAFLAAYISAAAVVFTGARVLVPAYASLGDLAERENRAAAASASITPAVPNPSLLLQYSYVDPLFKHLYASGFTKTPAELLEHPSPESLERDQQTFVESTPDVDRAAGRRDEGRGDQTAPESTPTEIETFAGTRERMLRAVDAFETQRRYETLRSACAVAGITFLFAIPVFAIASSTGAAPASVTEPIPVIVDFAEVPPEFGAQCTLRTGRRGTAIDGSLREPVVAFSTEGDCAAAVVRVAEDKGIAVPATTS